MSIKNKTGRKLDSPMLNKVPKSLSQNFEQATYLETLNMNLYQMYAILNDTTSMTSLDDDYTTIGSELLIATENVTITLNATPKDEEEVTIKNASGLIEVNGNGVNIDGSETAIISTLWDSITIIYIEDNKQWFII